MTRFACLTGGDATERLRRLAVVGIVIYVGALIGGPHHPVLWRELGLQVTDLGLVAGYVWRTSTEPGRRVTWRSGFGASFTFLTAGNLLQNGHSGSVPPEWETVGSMALFICTYPPAICALIGLGWGRWRTWTPASLLDGLISALAVASVFTAFVLPRAAAAADRGQVPLAMVLAFPICDLVMLALAVAATTLSGRWGGRMPGWLVLGLGIFGVADWQYAVDTADGTWRAGSLMDASWVIATAVVGLLACSPRRQGHRLSQRVWALADVAVPITSAMAALGTLAVGCRVDLPVIGVCLAVAAIGIALVRLALAYAEVQAMADTHVLARTDELTGLPNRRALMESLHATCARAAATPFALLVTDLDGFKAVNDRLGHEAGDRLLLLVAQRLRAALPADAVLARLGGDEFAAILPETATAHEVATRLVHSLDETLLVGGDRASVGLSVGLTVVDDGRTPSPAEALRRADLAMYTAKRAGGAQVHTSARDERVPAPRLSRRPAGRPG